MNLGCIGSIEIPAAALEHWHTREALACVQVLKGNRERIIGTENSGPPHCELYGWAPNIAKHQDCTGFVYFAPMISQLSCVMAKEPEGEIGRVWMRRGAVFRLYDFATHWTRDAGPCVCLFAGIFDDPDDARAIEMLQAGARALSYHENRAAPRVSAGFRVPLPWECYVMGGDNYKELRALDEAKARGDFIISCALCEEPAYSVDRFWPHHGEQNRCRAHFKGDAPCPSPRSPSASTIKSAA